MTYPKQKSMIDHGKPSLHGRCLLPAFVTALLATTAMISGNAPLMAQAATPDRQAQLSGALDTLKQAQARHDNAAATQADQLPTETGDLDQKVAQALDRIKQPATSPESAARDAKANAALEKARANLSAEGNRRLALEIPPPTLVAVSGPPAPDPQPRKAPRLTPKEKDETVITTGPDGTGLFDGNRKIAIFADATDGVVLDNPRIHINCEELEIHFKDDPAAAAPGSEGEDTQADAKPDPMLEDSSIEVAYARGKRVILRKKHADGKIQIGQCREAVYDGNTGDLVLKIWPQIQENEHIVVAKAASTRILILRDGRLKFVGPTETKVSKNR